MPLAESITPFITPAFSPNEFLIILLIMAVEPKAVPIPKKAPAIYIANIVSANANKREDIQ